MSRWPLILLTPLGLALAAVAVPPVAPQEKKPAAASDAEQAAGRAQVDPGLKVAVWASEPLLANPVAFAFDAQGGCYVAESVRFTHGVPDTRGHMQWLDEDLGSRSVADLLAMYKKHNYTGFEKYPDQLRKVWASAGSARADKSSIFSGGYNRPQDGLAAGVLARKDTVYFTCIPDLYKLRDTKGTNTADVKESLSTGYGIRAQFLGHDLHGLRMGPDGKLYFSIGDRGLVVKRKEGDTLSNPNSGAVLRCDPDGANLEIVHTGLRNPQELAFDDYGNLFTFDNNSDSGDRARWVYIVEGGDSGWRCGYQYGTYMHHKGVPQGNRGPWNAEKVWVPEGTDGGPPAYVVPAIANLGNGPSGITHYPGVGLGDRYKDHFFAADYTSSPSSSVIHSLALKPKGAAFAVVDHHPFVRNIVPSDCEFGPDGAFYYCEWTGGWTADDKGRILRLTDPEAMKNPAVAEAQKLLAEGFEGRSIDELVRLLGHPHQMVRQEAQFELADVKSGRRKADEVVPALAKVAKESGNKLARLHAVWGLGILCRSVATAFTYQTDAKAFAALMGIAEAKDPEVRRQVAVVLGYGAARMENTGTFDSTPGQLPTLIKLMGDTEPAVRAAAAVAYGRVSHQVYKSASQERPLFNLLKSNNDQDAYVRHAAVQALVTSTRNSTDLYNVWTQLKTQYDTPAVRLGVVLALRRLRGPQLEQFLADADPKVAAEAARAIYDERVEPALPALAALADTPGLPDPVAYRALAANFLLGEPIGARRLAAWAARTAEPDHLRTVALKLLADWPQPPRRDPITGLVFGPSPPGRPAAVATDALKPLIDKVFAGSDAVRAEAVQTVLKLGMTGVGPLMAALAADSGRPVAVRAEALLALGALKAPELADAVRAGLASPEPRLRAAARLAKSRSDPQAATAETLSLLADDRASPAERQAALSILGSLPDSAEVDTTLAGWLDRLAAGAVPAELKLELVEAGQQRTTAKDLKLHAPLKDKLKAADAAARKAEPADPLSRYRETLAGGDPEKGRDIFLANSAVYCQRCHKLDNQGGEVGPALNGIGTRQTRDYLLESILYPSKQIAKGYESVVLNLADGRSVTGVLRGRDGKGYTVVQADGKVLTIPKDDVDGEKPDKSAMPEDLHKKLSKRELRDLIEFLASLKDGPKP